ncbi:hypothetical protein AB3S75_037378 [Citrus x aurantiifolia]
MVREKVKVSTRTLQWKCVESRADSKRLYYGCFILSLLMKGQADKIGIVMRRVLLGEIEGTCITHAKSKKIPHEYSTIVGIQESVHEILMNLKDIVLRSNLYRTCDALICVKDPGYVTAQDILLPPSVEIVDNTQHIASLTEPIDLSIGLQIERSRGYNLKTPNTFQDGNCYPIDAVFMPVRNANHSITFHDRLAKLTKKKKEIALKSIFIDQSEMSPRIYNCLKKSNIHTLFDLLNTRQEDLMKIEHCRIEDVKQIMSILEQK